MGVKPETRVEALLDELCRVYGWCLPPDEEEALLAEPPQTVEAFVDAVIVADGEDPSLSDKRTRLELSDIIRDWLFDQGRGKGTRSGLPWA